MTLDDQGRVWLATQADGLVHFTPPPNTNRILWEYDTTMSADPLQTVQEIVNDLPAAQLGVRGKLYLEADLAASSGQPLASARYPFYIFPGSTGLTINSNKALYKPNESVTVSGAIINGSAETLANQTLTIWFNEQEIYTETGISIGANSQYDFTVTATTPNSAGSVTLKATVDTLTIQVVTFNQLFSFYNFLMKG